MNGCNRIFKIWGNLKKFLFYEKYKEIGKFSDFMKNIRKLENFLILRNTEKFEKYLTL